MAHYWALQNTFKLKMPTEAMQRYAKSALCVKQLVHERACMQTILAKRLPSLARFSKYSQFPFMSWSTAANETCGPKLCFKSFSSAPCPV